MRHNRKAVMAERYKLYMKKNIFNGRYFVRNLQILIGVITLTAMVIGGVVLGHSDKKEDVVTTNATVMDALFGNSEEEQIIEKDTTGPVTEEMTTTEEVTTQLAVVEEEIPVEEPAEPEEKSEFEHKCIANVEETLNIRKEPSAEAEFVGSMNPGAIAIVEGTEGDWTKIKSGDVEGYVLSQYVLTGESAEEFAEDYVTLRGTVLEDGVNIRSEKSTDANILVVLNKDDTITVLENPEDAEEEENEMDVAKVSATEDTSFEEIVVNAVAENTAGETATEAATEHNVIASEQETEKSAKIDAIEEITWVPVMLENGETGYVSTDFIEIDALYEIAVSAEELERLAAEEAARKAAEEEAARQALASQSSGNNGSSNSNSSYEGARTTPVAATESGECIGTFTITAYCGCDKCSGGSNKTASGTTPTEGRTIAADTSILPFGTQVVIDGIVYTVEDCGSGVNGNHIDIFFATHKAAKAFGKKTLKVYKY